MMQTGNLLNPIYKTTNNRQGGKYSPCKWSTQDCESSTSC